MTRFIAGTPIKEQFALSEYQTGETFTVSDAIGPAGAWAGPTVTESSGIYTAVGSESGTESTVGFYSCTLTGNTTGEEFAVVWHVITAPAAQFTTRANGQVPLATWWNTLQDAVSNLTGRMSEP